ncbi:MAG: transcription termination factor NusA [Candidatus Magasanikbacteria bacterium]|nr:transcription termination factor NusA [Candidatus Magasanikbacteria bacterium]
MSDLTSAIKQICEEKGLSYEAVIETIESALSAAYRKDFGTKNQNIKVEFDPETTKSKVFDVKTVVEDLPEEELAELEKGEEEAGEEKTEKPEIKKEEVEGVEGEEEEKKFNPKTDLQISDAKLIKKTAKVGDELRIKLEIPAEYGRMAAQTAKQVIIQRLREAEREMVFNDFKDKEHEVVNGTVQRREGKIVLVDLGKSIGVLPSEEQIYGENYAPGERIKVYVKEVSLRPKGPEIILSRTSDEILKKVFNLEIPEVSNGLIEIKSVAREAGLRAKVAVYTAEENVDPIGSCVGQRGARIQTIISELGGEKVDIIEYDENPVKFIANALSPAKIINITTFPEEKRAEVFVAENQLSLAIGKGGQNARLAAKLTGWKIDIIQASDNDVKKDAEEKAAAEEKEGEAQE